MPRGLPKIVSEHLKKARECAILAVEIYNKPATEFRTGGFVVLMCIAYTALYHAIFIKEGKKPFYRDNTNPRRFAKIDGDYKAWELKTCVQEYFGSNNPAERKNLEFFIGLRNKIEHRSLPPLDHRIFGECQALLFNFEDLLVQHFGTRYALNESLALALQFSHLRDEDQAKAISSLHKPLSADIEKYIQSFRSALSNEEMHDLRYSYKVFLIPKLASNPGNSTLAVEFVKYDPSKPEEMAKYRKVVTFLKPQQVPVVNPGMLKASDISTAVAPIVKRIVGFNKSFGASYHHVRACYFYKVRSKRGEGDPKRTDVKYCQYDEAHHDYVYTSEWKDFLIAEMKKPGQYEKVMNEGR